MGGDDEIALATIKGIKPIAIPEGEYDLVFQYHVTGYLYGRSPKICCFFKIVTMGEFYEMVFPRYYNVRTLTSKPRKGGSFETGWKSDFMREYVRVHGMPQRPDRVSPNDYRNVIVRGQVGTVKTDSKQRSIPDPLRYSVIKEILRKVQ